MLPQSEITVNAMAPARVNHQSGGSHRGTSHRLSRSIRPLLSGGEWE